MMMQPELIRDCFKAWCTSSNSHPNSELVFIFHDREESAQPGSSELRHVAARTEALLPAGVPWVGPDGLRYCVRSVRLEGRGVKLVRVQREARAPEPCAVGLSRRETEVFACLADGLNHKEIARKLFISSHTARKHIENIYSKLNVCNRIEAINKLRPYSRPLENTANNPSPAQPQAATK